MSNTGSIRDTVSLPYQCTPPFAVLSVVFALAMTAFAGWLLYDAVSGRGEPSVILLVVLAAMMAMMLALAAYRILEIIRSNEQDRVLVLSPDAVQAPQSVVSKVVVRIPYSEITELGLEKRKLGVHGFKITGTHGEKISFVSWSFANGQVFRDIVAHLENVAPVAMKLR